MTAVVEATIQPVAPAARLTWRRIAQRPLGLIGGVMLLIALLVAITAPFIAPYDPYARVRVTIMDIYQAPSAAHPLGTDDGGKDVLSSLIYGARVSLIVGFAAATITSIIGGLVGIVAGYRGGRTGTLADGDSPTSSSSSPRSRCRSSSSPSPASR